MMIKVIEGLANSPRLPKTQDFIIYWEEGS